MPSTRALSITLPEEMARAVHARVESGAYANESEVISEGLRALGAQEQVVERWLATEGVARFDAFAAAPDQTLATDKAGDRLRAHIERRGTRNRGCEALVVGRLSDDVVANIEAAEYGVPPR